MSTPVADPPEPELREESRSFRRRLLISTARLAIVVTIAATIGGGWYLARKGFGRQTRARVTEELRKRGVDASIGQLTLNPFRGLVAHNVRVFQYDNRENVLAEVSEIALDINFAAFFQHQPFINAIDIRDANLTMPVDAKAPDAPKAELRKVRAHVYFPSERIEVTQAQGFFGGVRISVTGELIKRNDYVPSHELTEEEWRQRRELIYRAASELALCDFAGTHPSLQVKFSGDLAEMENARVEAQLRADHLKRGTYEIRGVAIDGEWANQTLNISQCEWKDAVGTFTAHARWVRSNGTAEFGIRTSTDIRQFLFAFGYQDALKELNYQIAPVIELTGTADTTGEKPRLQVVGHTTLAAFTYKQVPFISGTAQFSWDGERTLVREIHLRHLSGAIDGEVLNMPGDFRADIRSSVKPSDFRAAAPANIQQFLSEWEWESGPAIQMSVHGASPKPETWSGDGTVAFARTRFRGVGMNSASVKVHFGDGVVSYNDVRIARDEGVATGAFTYDFAKRQVAISNVKSTLRPTDIAIWIDPKLLKAISPYKFREVPNVTANGIYQFGGGKNTRIDIGVESRALDYVFLGKTLPFDSASAKLLFTDDRLQITQLDAALFSGLAHGTADISLAKSDQHYTASVRIDKMNFPALSDLYFQFKSAQGELNGHFDFSGVSDDARAIRGQGHIAIKNGDVFAIPVFGPLSGLLNGLFAGHAGYSVARKGTADFKMNEGVLHTDNLDIGGQWFHMVGHGDVYALDDRLDMDVRVDPSGAAILLSPVYKLFEYKGEGSLKHPDWHRKGF